MGTHKPYSIDKKGTHQDAAAVANKERPRVPLLENQLSILGKGPGGWDRCEGLRPRLTT